MTAPNDSQQPQQPQPQYGVAPQQKAWYKRPGCIIPLIIVVILILIVGGCSAMFGKAVNDIDESLNKEYTVTYEIDGDTQDAIATYNVGETNTVTDTGLKAGWSKDVKVTGLFGPFLDAMNGMYDNGSITCRILVDGKTVIENTATGANASASCSATVQDLEEAAT